MNGTRQRVLVLDDEEAIRNYLRFILQKAGYSVETYAESESAVKRFGEVQFEAVVADIVLPGSDGVEAMIAMRKIKPKTRFIAISGAERKDRLLEIARIHHVGATVSKPFREEEILAAMRER